MKAIEFSEPR